MILRWERRAEKEWQAILWRKLIESAPGLHPPALSREFRALLREGAAPLPERVAWFGISTLPPFYVGFLEELAKRVEVHFFAMRPTPEWWNDIRSEREEMRARRKAPATAQLDLQFERGNPLLASLGKTGREFLEAITTIDVAREQEQFRAPGNENLLTGIQRDIFQLHDPSGATPRPVESR